MARNTVQITVRVSVATAEWIRAEAWKRKPVGRKLPEVGALVEEIVTAIGSGKTPDCFDPRTVCRTGQDQRCPNPCREKAATNG
jgi:hypothetical protein